jgi:CheY-like chemotaxis protein
MNNNLLRIAFADDDQDDHLFFFQAVKEVYELALINNFFSSQDLIDFFSGRRNIAPHIFFLDINMPGNLKFECLDAIKNDPFLNTVPVVIYSTSASAADITTALSKGAAAFITKPDKIDITAEVLRETIGKYVEIRFKEKPIRANASLSNSL